MSTRAGFQKKVVPSQQSLGAQLKATRAKKNISLASAEQATKIRLHYLEAMEQDRFHELPGSHYKGFVRRYAAFLHLSADQIERDIEILPLHPVRKQSFTPWTQVKRSQLFVTPRGVAIVCSVVVLLGFIGYVTYQVRQFAAPPKLAIIKPQDESVSTEESFKIEGQTDTGASVTIDNLQTSVDSEGKFSYVLTLRPGLNQITVRSENRIKKQSSRVVTVLYQPPAEATPVPQDNSAVSSPPVAN